MIRAVSHSGPKMATPYGGREEEGAEHQQGHGVVGSRHIPPSRHRPRQSRCRCCPLTWSDLSSSGCNPFMTLWRLSC